MEDSGATLGRLRGRAAFEELRTSGARRRSGPVTVTWAAARSGSASARACVGFAIGRNVGGAVVRNRLRRRLREVVSASARAGSLPPGSYLISARPEASDLPFSELERLLSEAIGALPSRG